MSNKIETILKNINQHADQAIYDKIVDECGILEEKATPANQGKYAVSLLQSVLRHCGEIKIVEIMQPCGYECISNGTIEKAKKLYAVSSDFADFLIKLNEQHIGGGLLHIEGDRVIGIYNRCYCGLAKNAKNLSSSYCNCSAGWFKKLFSSVLNKDIEVRKMKTILDGADECTFEIFALSQS